VSAKVAKALRRLAREALPEAPERVDIHQRRYDGKPHQNHTDTTRGVYRKLKKLRKAALSK
jgi:hypothetical protein